MVYFITSFTVGLIIVFFVVILRSFLKTHRCRRKVDKAKALASQRQLLQACNLLREVIEALSGKSSYAEAEGRCLYEATTSLIQTLLKDNKVKEALAEIGNLEKLQRALPTISESLFSKFLLYLRAMVDIKSGSTEQQLKGFSTWEQLFREDPQNFALLRNLKKAGHILAQWLSVEGKFDEGIALLQRLLDYSQDGETKVVLGRLHCMKARQCLTKQDRDSLASAWQELLLAFDAEPTNKEYTLYQGVCALQLGLAAFQAGDVNLCKGYLAQMPPAVQQKDNEFAKGTLTLQAACEMLQNNSTAAAEKLLQLCQTSSNAIRLPFSNIDWNKAALLHLLKAKDKRKEATKVIGQLVEVLLEEIPHIVGKDGKALAICSALIGNSNLALKAFEKAIKNDADAQNPFSDYLCYLAAEAGKARNWTKAQELLLQVKALQISNLKAP